MESIFEQHNVSDEERAFINEEIGKSKDILIFTIGQFRAFANALYNQFSYKTKWKEGEFHFVKSFTVYPLNKGLKIKNKEKTTLLQLPYMSPNFKYFKPRYSSYLAEEVCAFCYSVYKNTNNKFVLLVKDPDGGLVLKSFDLPGYQISIVSGELYFAKYAKPMRSFYDIEQYWINKYHQRVTKDSGILIVPNV